MKQFGWQPGDEEPDAGRTIIPSPVGATLLSIWIELSNLLVNSPGGLLEK